MRIREDNWRVLASLFPPGWQEMALQSGAFERLREFASPGVRFCTLLLHVARGYSLRETMVRAMLAHWAEVSDVALLKRPRNSEDWKRRLARRYEAGEWIELESYITANSEAHFSHGVCSECLPRLGTGHENK